MTRTASAQALRPAGPLLLLAALVLLAPAARAEAAAKAGPATAAVRKANDGLRVSLKKMVAAKGADWEKARGEARAAVASLLDFEALAEGTLGKRWKERSAAEKKRYVEAMRAAMEASYLSRMQGKVTVDEVKVEYLSETEKNGHPIVATRLIAGADSASIDYLMEKTGAKKQRAIDVITEGVSLAEIYREQIDLLWPKKGFEGVVTAFEKKAKRFEADLVARRAEGAGAAPVKAAK